MVSQGAKAAAVFPVVSGYDVEGAIIEGLTIEGNREHNPRLDGCRGGGRVLLEHNRIEAGTAIQDLRKSPGGE